jgi:hypothetical protein
MDMVEEELLSRKGGIRNLRWESEMVIPNEP